MRVWVQKALCSWLVVVVLLPTDNDDGGWWGILDENWQLTSVRS
jgi:hypothetical protein